MRYWIVTQDLQGGSFGMDRAYTAEGWGEQAFDWADGDGYENPEEWLLENHESEEHLIHDIADWWELRFAEINEEQKQRYETLLEDIDIAGTNCYSAELKHDIEEQKKWKAEYRKLSDELGKFYEEVSHEV